MTVRHLAREGEIPAVSKIPARGKIGRQWRVRRSLLARWIADKSMPNVGASSG
jgi:hypothetical protein